MKRFCIWGYCLKWRRDTVRGAERVTEWRFLYSDGEIETVTKRERMG